MTREAYKSALSGPRQIAGGLALGAGMVSAAVLAMRPIMLGMLDPSAANTLVASVVVLLAGTVVAKAVVEGGFVLPPACVTAPLGFLLFIGLVMTVFAAHVWPAEVQLFTWITHALVLLGVYALLARHPVYEILVLRSELLRKVAGDGTGRTAPLEFEQERDGLTRVVVAAVLATAAVVALYGVYQRYAVLPGLVEEARESLTGRRILANPLGLARMKALEAFGPFVYPNAMAGYLVLLLPVSLGFGAGAHLAGKRAAAVAGWAVAGLLVYVLFLTGSKGGAVAAVSGVATAAAFYWRKPIAGRLDAVLPEGRKKRALVVAGVIVVAAGLAAAAFLYLTTQSLTMRVRAGYWRTALRMIVDRPLGVGLGNFGEHYSLYKTPAAWETQEAHNVFLCLAAEAGLAALVALGFLLRGFLRVTRRGPSESAYEQLGSTALRRAPLMANSASLLKSAGRASSSPAAHDSFPEVATVGNLRALGVVGGGTALLICLVSGPWLNVGLPGTDTAGACAMTAALFAAWGVVFWLASSVDIRSNAVLAGVVGGIAAIFVHGLVDFTFRIKGVVFTAAALGAVALAVSSTTLRSSSLRSTRDEPVRVRLRGLRGFALSSALAFSLAFVLWRGVSRPMRLAWHQENARTHADWSARLDRLRYRVRGAASGRRIDRARVREALSEIEDETLSAMADGVRVAVESGTDAAIREAVSELAGQLKDDGTDSLRKAWRFLEKYMDGEPGDERVVVRLAEVGEKLAARGADIDADRVVGGALLRLAELSPVSFVPRKLLGDLLARQGHLAEAAAAFEKAAALYPEKPELWLRAGDARLFSDSRKAAAHYARALDANRLAEDERTLLYSRYWRTGPKRPASPDFPRRLDRADAHGATPEIAFRRALMYAEIGGFAEAIGEIDRAIEARPGEVQLRLFRAIFLEMEAARARSQEADVVAGAAWDTVERMQAAARPGRRVSDYTLGLVTGKRDAIRRAALGAPAGVAGSARVDGRAH